MKFGLADTVLRDQRQKFKNSKTKEETLYYLRSLPRMPRDLKRAMYSLQNKHNANRLAFLNATEVQCDEQLPGQMLLGAAEGEGEDEANQSLLDSQLLSEANKAVDPDTPESNKYARNVLLVLENIVEGFSGLFSLEEKQVYAKFKDELSLQA